MRHLRDEVLAAYLEDNVKARHMLSSGAYSRKKAGAGRPKINSQEYLLRRRPAHKQQKNARLKLRP